MTTKLYIQDRFITTINELRQLVEESGDNPSTMVAKQLIAAACDGLLDSWLKNASDEKECQKYMPQKQLISLKDSERWKYIKEVLTGTAGSIQWNWQDKIELVKVPDDSFWEVLEKKETAHLKFIFNCKSVMDEQINLRLRGDGFLIQGQDFVIPDREQVKEYVLVLDMNKSTQELVFDVEGCFKGKHMELYVEDSPTPIWRQERKDGMYKVKGVRFKMIRVGGGKFQMGEGCGRHEVELSGYNIGETVVTQELWQAVMGYNPSHFIGTDRPVECVSWHDCQRFIQKLNQETGKQFRLPTEAEWEFAARSGNKEMNKNFTYSGSNDINDVAWYEGNSHRKTHPVKEYGKRPNGLGIYDMSGNVCEWCQDWMGIYTSFSQVNPTGPSNGPGRVYRGGGWNSSVVECRVSERRCSSPDVYKSYLGFRLALSE